MNAIAYLCMRKLSVVIRQLPVAISATVTSSFNSFDDGIMVGLASTRLAYFRSRLGRALIFRNCYGSPEMYDSFKMTIVTVRYIARKS